jgi:hypothetical protein
MMRHATRSLPLATMAVLLGAIAVLVPEMASAQKYGLGNSTTPAGDVVLKVQMKLDVAIATIAAGTPARTKFEADFTTAVAAKLNIEAKRVTINSIKAGSVIVDFSIKPDASGKPIAATAITSAFNSPGMSIAGAKTTAAVTAASLTAAPLVTGVCTGNTVAAEDVTCPSGHKAKASGTKGAPPSLSACHIAGHSSPLSTPPVGRRDRAMLCLAWRRHRRGGLLR